MAKLQAHQEPLEHPLVARVLIGRSPACGLRLTEPHASGEHAIITWTGWHWEARDLGSRNGTFVDGNRLEPGTAVKLTAGARIAFGDPERPWTLVDDGAPSMIAIEANTGRVRAAEAGLLVLPEDDQPLLTFYQNATGEWLEESGEATRVVRDQEQITLGDSIWQLHLPSISEGTPLMQLSLSLETVSLEFAVSRDEERVEVKVIHRGVEQALEPREHGYVLLTLARARLEDEQMPLDQRGWRNLDRLEKMLAMDANALNVAIHRARQQLAQAGVSNAANLVEVRRKQRRLGTDRFRIVAL